MASDLQTFVVPRMAGVSSVQAVRPAIQLVQPLPLMHARSRPGGSRVAARGFLGFGAAEAVKAVPWWWLPPSRVEAIVGAVAALLVVAKGSKKRNGTSKSGVVPTRKMVEAAQKEWSDGIVAISAAKANGGDYAQMAHDHIKKMYGYDQGPVCFKPTLASDVPFRPTFEGAFSYFAATNGFYKEDKGFAIAGWTAVRWENHQIITDSDSALAMGDYFFSLPDGTVKQVEYTFGYFVDADGKLRINLHHSSLNPGN